MTINEVLPHLLVPHRLRDSLQAREAASGLGYSRVWL
jgi:hypothetical protein